MTDGYGQPLTLGDDVILRGRVVSMRADQATLELYGTWTTKPGGKQVGGPLRITVPVGALVVYVVEREKPRRRKLKRTA